MINPDDKCGNMTIRTMIATGAMDALLSNPSVDTPRTTREAFARDAVMYADTLIKELNNSTPVKEKNEIPCFSGHEHNEDCEKYTKKGIIDAIEWKMYLAWEKKNPFFLDAMKKSDYFELIDHITKFLKLKKF